MKLTKKQRLIYDWLISKPGYLKKSADKLCEISDLYGSLKDHEIALKEARKDNKFSDKVIIDNFSKSNELVILDNIKKFGIEYHPKDVAFKTNVSKQRNQSGTYFVSGCIHAPWQNKLMFDSVLNFLKKEVDLYGIILAGDIIDLNSLSSHDKGKKPIKGVTLDWEYSEANKFLDTLDDLNIKGTKDYIYGNHEDRYLRYMKDIDNSKLGSALQSPEIGLKLRERGYNVYTDWKNDAISLGVHLDINHGEFLNVHTAKKTIDTYRKSNLYFHTHRYQVYTEGKVGGFNMGFGGDIDAPIFGFATRAMKLSWTNSCTLVHLDKDGMFHVQPLVYVNNQLIVNGKKY